MKEGYHGNFTVIKLTEDEVRRMLRGQIIEGYKTKIGMEVCDDN